MLEVSQRANEFLSWPNFWGLLRVNSPSEPIAARAAAADLVQIK